MIRVLHLCDTSASFQAQRGALQLAREPGDGFEAELRTVGRGGSYRDVLTAARALRSEEGRGFDLVHCWGGACLTAAAMGFRGPVVHAGGEAASGKSLRWLGAVMTCRDVQVICPTATQQAACLLRGIAPDRCHLIRPGVDFSRVRRRRDPALRRELGLCDGDFVMLLAGESTDGAAHREAIWGTSILHVWKPQYKALLWGRGPQAKSVVQFADRLGTSAMLHVAERRLGRRVEFEELLSAADAVVITAAGAVATLPISICMAAALPIVATVSPTVSELLEDRHTALMCQSTPKALARRVLDAQQDARLQWSISDMARTEAYEFFSLTRFLNQHRELYRQVISGGKVHLPEPAAGAGSRFHGRALLS